jgi:hypothetical protein
MINQVPGRLNRKFTTPFELVHNETPNPATWFQLFSIGYFGRDKDSTSSRSKSEDQSLDGIAVGRDDKSNTIIFYNPITKNYYCPPNFKLDEGCLPVTNFPKSITYSGGLTCGLLRNKTDPAPEPFPPGTRLTIQVDDRPLKGTVQNVPLPRPGNLNSPEQPEDPSAPPSADPSEPPDLYTILLDDGTTIERKYESIIATIRPTQTADPSKALPSKRVAGIPTCFQNQAKVTYDQKGAYHNYLSTTPRLKDSTS